MALVELKRYEKGPNGTRGEMWMDGKFLCHTIEEPDNDNKPRHSCIPEGTYACVSHNGPKWKDVWEITNVPGRSAILIHAGNSIEDVSGCVAVGKKIGMIHGLPAVLESRLALNYLRGVLPDHFEIKITWEPR